MVRRRVPGQSADCIKDALAAKTDLRRSFLVA
jgi:hypothetical protein